MSEPFYDDLPPHKIGATGHRNDMRPPRPIEGAVVHFVEGPETRCRAAIVVALLEEAPLDPEYRIDVVVFTPRPPRPKNDRFTKTSQPGSTRWANNLEHAPIEDHRRLTWHWPSAGCVPSVQLSG